jgi:hypothetical protein
MFKTLMLTAAIAAALTRPVNAANYTDKQRDDIQMLASLAIAASQCKEAFKIDTGKAGMKAATDGLDAADLSLSNPLLETRMATAAHDAVENLGKFCRDTAEKYPEYMNEWD